MFKALASEYYALKTESRNPDKVAKIVTSLNLKIPPRDIKSKDTRHLLSLIFSQWLSLSTCIIQAIVDVVPPPQAAQRIRIPKMLYPEIYEPTIEPKTVLEKGLYSCNGSKDASVVALVSKMFAVPVAELPSNKKKPMTAEEMRSRAKAAREAREAAQTATEQPSGAASIPLETAVEQLEIKGTTENTAKEGEEVLLGFSRIYSGTIRTGTSIFCVLPKFDNSLGPTHPKNASHIVMAEVEALYVMMGRELVPVESVQAGNVFAIQGLEGKVWRNATLCASSGDGIGQDHDIALAKDSLLNLGGASNSVRMVHEALLDHVMI